MSLGPLNSVNQYYFNDIENDKLVYGTLMLSELCEQFEKNLLKRNKDICKNVTDSESEEKFRKEQNFIHLFGFKRAVELGLIQGHIESSSKSVNSSGDDSDEDGREITESLNCNGYDVMKHKTNHPRRLHKELWYNEVDEMNDGPACRCSRKARKSGIRHGIYMGETRPSRCLEFSNNSNRLHHFIVSVYPLNNFLPKVPTMILYNNKLYNFEGFSMFSHEPLTLLTPPCKVIRFHIEYTITYVPARAPKYFTIYELDLFYKYLFVDILELLDIDFHDHNDTNCSMFHFLPRFVNRSDPSEPDLLPMHAVLQHLINSNGSLIETQQLQSMITMDARIWQAIVDQVQGMIVIKPGSKPSSIRVDQLDRNLELQNPTNPEFPEIVHFGLRPAHLSYAGNADYQRALRDYVKYRHLLAKMPKPKFEDKQKLDAKDAKLQEMRKQNNMKRDVDVALSSEGFYRTGIMCDVVQHALLLPLLVSHLRFHKSLDYLEKHLNYQFRNRGLLQLALTHPSYRENFGTNPDHVRNSLTNCGLRQPEYGDRRIHFSVTRKRGINTLINIMSKFGKEHDTESKIKHNERLEFLGDAVVEFITTIHLYFMFPDLEEGGLATYRASLVQNQHLAVLAEVLELDKYLLYAHGSDLCHDIELRHAMANCFEALMGALFLDGGLEIADKIFGEILFKSQSELMDVWQNLPKHPLQISEPQGDRHWIEKYEVLQKLVQFENSVGIQFKHIRLLARAFTDRSIGYTNLTLGSNQRLEFLGDTVLQLIASAYLYRHFPDHHEGHLSLLRSSLVNNKTQSVVCNDLGLTNYALYNNPKVDIKTKDRADLLEAFVGAIYVDSGIEPCDVFCQVCLFPRLQTFILNQDWNDPKSKLQQCCLTLRTMDGREPDMPFYKVVEAKGPTNTRIYSVAVYFRGERLAKGSGHTIQQAEMNAAKEALKHSRGKFLI